MGIIESVFVCVFILAILVLLVGLVMFTLYNFWKLTRL